MARSSLRSWLEGGLTGAASPRRLGAKLRGAGRVTLRLRLTASDYDYWHLLEQAWRRVMGPPMSFLRYCCLCVWDAWRHYLPPGGERARALARGRGRCACPVCGGRAEQRHHLVFRSHGGSDHENNLIDACMPCHLRGIHQGRLTAAGTADRLSWTIGRRPLMRVEGRERRVA